MADIETLAFKLHAFFDEIAWRSQGGGQQRVSSALSKPSNKSPLERQYETCVAALSEPERELLDLLITKMRNGLSPGR